MGPQSLIAHYRITSKLGEGGMGEVWRATDTKLSRDVAIKVLPDSFANDPDRLARFTREAQMLASLNHPNIAAIYGVEERAIVMELVDGATLADRIARGPIPLDEVLPIARQIAEALEYAHEKGVIHRDLKPANVKVTPEGKVKVLDFGLAKALTQEVSAANPESSPTMTMRSTVAGVIMGTAGYMSPEQARGKPVDKRADIWAFGVVVYEMLIGRKLFAGETVADTLAALVKEEPDWTALPAETPPHILRLLQRCLRKDATKRLRDIGEARLAIEDPPPEVLPPSAAVIRESRRWPWIAALAATLSAALVLALLLWRANHPAARTMQRLSVDLGADAVAGIRNAGVISPDGARIAYVVRGPNLTTLVATRRMDQAKPTILPGTENPVDLFFSADGQWIGFFSAGKMKKVSVHGGAPIPICDAPNSRGAAWGEDGNIIANLASLQLSRVSANGGAAQPLKLADTRDKRTHRWPQILPGGDSVLITVHDSFGPTAFDNAGIAVLSLKTGEIRTVARGGYFGRYLPTGHLVYVHQGTLLAVPFDLARLEVRGSPVPFIDDIGGQPGFGAGGFDFALDGTLVYASGSGGLLLLPLVWMEATGKQQTMVTALRPLTPRISPDGKRIAMSIVGEVWTYDIQREVLSRLTVSANATAPIPVWTPDGRHIVFRRSPGGLMWVRSDGSGQAQLLYDAGNSSPFPGSFSPDGRLLAVEHSAPGATGQIWILPLDTSDPDHPKVEKPQQFVASPDVETDPAFSPDGRWLAYVSNGTGSDQVYVTPFPEGTKGGRWQVSAMPGRFPIWSRTARELFYLGNDGRIQVAPYTFSGRTFSAGKPRVWSETPIFTNGRLPQLDLAPDGKRFLVSPASAATGDKGSVHMTFLINFFDELKRRVP